MTKVQFDLAAEVNGERFEMVGDGTGDADEGRCSLSIEVEDGGPEGFDPMSCPFICHQQTSLSFAKATDEAADLVDVAGGEYAVEPDRMGVIRNKDGEKLAHIEVTGEVTREDGTLVSTQTMTGTSDLPELAEIVTPVTDHIVPAGPGAATGITRYELETVDGERLDAITTVPYRWEGDTELSAPIVREAEVNAEFDGEMLDVVYEISMSSVAGGETEPRSAPTLGAVSDD